MSLITGVNVNAEEIRRQAMELNVVVYIVKLLSLPYLEESLCHKITTMTQ